MNQTCKLIRTELVLAQELELFNCCGELIPKTPANPKSRKHHYYSLLGACHRNGIEINQLAHYSFVLS